MSFDHFKRYPGIRMEKNCFFAKSPAIRTLLEMRAMENFHTHLIKNKTIVPKSFG